jgi:hypothetical protein
VIDDFFRFEGVKLLPLLASLLGGSQINLLDAVQDPTMYRCPKHLRLVVTVIAERSVEWVDGSVPKIIDRRDTVVGQRGPAAAA